MIKTPRTVAFILSYFASGAPWTYNTAAYLAMADAGPVNVGSLGPARTNKKSRWKRMRRTAAYHNSH